MQGETNCPKQLTKASYNKHMNISFFLTQLAHQAASIHSMCLGVSAEQARWKPEAESWSILEVINHLYDEEREDFRTHVDQLLNHPEQSWHLIDPMGWVTERHYNGRDLELSINNLLYEREQSLAWLSSLVAPNWEAVRRAPWGEIRAGDVMASWAAHDVLHLRQLVELRWAYTVQMAKPYDVRYAGEW